MFKTMFTPVAKNDITKQLGSNKSLAYMYIIFDVPYDL